MLTLLFRSENKTWSLAIFDLLFAALLVGFWFLIRSPLFAQHPEYLTIGILIDLLVTVPILYWVFWRKAALSLAPVLVVLFTGILFASLVVPAAQQTILLPFQIAVGAILIVGSSWILRDKSKSFLANYKSSDDYDHKRKFETAFEKVFGSSFVTRKVGGELACFSYLFRTKFTTPEKGNSVDAPSTATEFSYHMKSGLTALLLAFCLVIVVEMTGVHVLFSLWSSLLAWLATASSAYFLFFVAAHIRAIRARPIFTDQATLFLRNGLLMSAEIPFENIDRIELTGTKPQGSDEPLSFSMPASHNVVVYLKQTQACSLLYGIQKTFQVALIYIDDPSSFQKTVADQESS